jgi:hypothetical protein
MPCRKNILAVDWLRHLQTPTRMAWLGLLVWLGTWTLANDALAQTKLPKFFSDSMVLQRDTKIQRLGLGCSERQSCDFAGRSNRVRDHGQ